MEVVINIAFKLGEFDFDEDFSRFGTVCSKIEIQMLSKDLLTGFDNCKRVIDNCTSSIYLDEVVLHLPFPMHTFELFLISQSFENTLITLIKDVCSYADDKGIKIWLLLHQEHNLEIVETVNGIERIRSILDSITSDYVGILIENCLPCLNSKDNKVLNSFELVDRISHDKLKSCFDICHARCYENILRCEYPITRSQVDSIKWIHFSDTYDNDGYRDSKTHGRVHKSLLGVYKDIRYLKIIGIDLESIPVCIEVTEEDFKSKPDMLVELNFLQKVQRIPMSVNNVIRLDC